MPAPLPPVPESATVCGEPVALSVNVIAPVTAPAAVGSKETVTVHVAPAVRELEHVLEGLTKAVDPVS